ncbi:MAG TPA: ATP-binding cassette domain-containing protein [Candidatus Limnocylindria bacterium]|nr:ATP-binding cassette domain-containing protein [Candidatus Limnocylindria bacterium]
MATTAAPLVELRDLRHTYLDGTPRASTALRGVSLTIEPGERVAIVGPTMSGKSTLVDAFAHLVRLRPGMVFFRGEDIAAPDYDRTALRRQVGILFQQPDAQIIEDVVGKDVAFGPTQAGLPAEECRRRVEESLNALGLPYAEYRLRYIHALSGGQRRRVAIAGVLAMHTPLLVLDEPMAGLDPRGRAELLRLLQRLCDDRQLTIVVASASVSDAALLCDRLVVLDAGRVVMDGPMREVLKQADRLLELDITLPDTVRSARALRDVLPGLPTELLSEDELEAEVLRRLAREAA